MFFELQTCGLHMTHHIIMVNEYGKIITEFYHLKKLRLDKPIYSFFHSDGRTDGQMELNNRDVLFMLDTAVLLLALPCKKVKEWDLLLSFVLLTI